MTMVANESNPYPCFSKQEIMYSGTYCRTKHFGPIIMFHLLSAYQHLQGRALIIRAQLYSDNISNLTNTGQSCLHLLNEKTIVIQ